MRICILIPFLVCAWASVGQLSAQRNVRQFVNDYFVNVPRQYSPDDPWTMGRILRIQVGHGGSFYNCDSEECKRYSPYITWNRQPAGLRSCQNVFRTIDQQLGEVVQRVRWGACYDCGGGCESQNCHCNSCGITGHPAGFATNPVLSGQPVVGTSAAPGERQGLLASLRLSQDQPRSGRERSAPARSANADPLNDRAFRMIR